MISLICGIQNMTQKNLSTTETDSQTQKTNFWLPKGKGVWERDGGGVWGQQMQTITYRMDKQQGPIVQHRELYSISSDKP